MEHVALFVVGLALLATGAPMLVVGAARLDLATGRGPFAVGIVAVAFGPCVTGLAFDLAVVLRPLPPVATRFALATAVERLIGSGIAGIGLVLGAAALAGPVAATARLFRTAIPVAVGAVLLFWFLAADKQLSRVDAGILLAAFAASLVLLIRAARNEPEAVKAEFASWLPTHLSLRLAVVMALAGLAATIGGALLAAQQVLEATRALKLSSPVMGETVAAFGTSLPALVAAVLAARRGRSNIALGIVVGSVAFQTLFVTGAVALAQPLSITGRAVLNEIPAMGLATLLLVKVLFNDLRASRWEGVILLAAFAGFLVWQAFRIIPFPGP